MKLQRLKPAVEKHWLLLLSGIVWTGFGVVLCLFAFSWLASVQQVGAAALALAGIVLACLIYRFGFSRIARQNIRRICLMRGKVCAFAFQGGRSYLIAGFMSGLGIAIRSSAMPKPYLAIMYLGIGGGLLLSSLHYYRRLLRSLPPS